MKTTLTRLLSFNAGYVDTAGFLALQGLFTAHVTGNFVTFGASIALGTSGTTAKLLALPVFCVTVVIVRLIGRSFGEANERALSTLLLVKIALLALAALLAIRFGPFADGDAWQAIVTGMVLVAAMAIQNGVHRIHLTQFPPTTLMTGTTTQIMLDAADLLLGVSGEDRQKFLQRLSGALGNVIGFALGCGAAALTFIHAGVWCFVLPPVIAVATLLISRAKAAKHGVA